MQAKKITEKIHKARTNLAEKVSVAGLKEALQEEVLWIRRIYQIAIFVCSCCILWKTYLIIIDWLGSGYTTEISDVANQEFLPVSNVTVCAQVFFNETFIRENISISQKLADRFTMETNSTLDSLYYQLTNFLSITTRPRQFNSTMLTYFSKVIRGNPHIHNYSAFTSAALPRCENMLRRCFFNGVQFDCCDRAVQSVDDDGTCYLLALNFDSDNAAPTALTFNQTTPGPRGGLTLEASMPLAAFPWIDDVADNGYRIYVNAVPYSAAQSPLGAPHGAETFVKVTPAKRLLSTNCALPGKLTMPGGEFLYYDPEGRSCAYRKFTTFLNKYISCNFPITLYRPNNSIACHPTTTHFAMSIFAASDLVETGQNIFHKSAGASEQRVLKTINQLEVDLRNLFTHKSYCPKHCHYWTYSSTASFVYLQKKGTNDEVNNQEEMFSKIHIFYADLGYRQYQETKETKGKAYLAFCNFSNVAMLYLGMSAVSFFDLLFYLCRYFYAQQQHHLRKRRKTNLHFKRKTIRNVKVHPQGQTNSESSV